MGREKSGARVSISRPHGSGKDYIRLEIDDNRSSITLVELEIDLESFAKALTGLQSVPATYLQCIDENDIHKINKRKVTEHVYCNRLSSVSSTKEDQRAEVFKHFNHVYRSQGWELWSDGTRSQQRSDEHRYVICKYVEVEDE